jgi:hypothetical protein
MARELMQSTKRIGEHTVYGRGPTPEASQKSAQRAWEAEFAKPGCSTPSEWPVMSSNKIALRDRLTMIAAQARLISIAATALNEKESYDSELTGVVELADRIERQLVEIADEIKKVKPNDLDGAARPDQTQRLQSMQPMSPLKASRRR